MKGIVALIANEKEKIKVNKDLTVVGGCGTRPPI